MLEDRNGGAEGGMKMRGREGERESRGEERRERKMERKKKRRGRKTRTTFRWISVGGSVSPRGSVIGVMAHIQNALDG